MIRAASLASTWRRSFQAPARVYPSFFAIWGQDAPARHELLDHGHALEQGLHAVLAEVAMAQLD